MYGEIGHKVKTTVAPWLISYNTPPYATGIGAYYWMHYAIAGNISTAKTVDANGTVGAMPWIVPNAITLTQVGIDVTSVTSVDAGGKIRFGIYTDSGSYAPGALVADLGTIAGDATSTTNPTFTTAFSLNLQPGIYWVAVAMQGMATARPTVGSITIAGGPNTMNTLSSGHGIPLIGGTNSRSWYSWAPSTTPAFTVVTTTFLVAPQWGGGLTSSSNSFPRLAIKIA